MIEEADICFDGLTVIAGENDTGKSTIGKLMFSLIKTFNRYERDARLYQARNIQTIIDDYYFDSRKKANDPNFLEIGRSLFEELKNSALELLGTNKSKKQIESFISQRVSVYTEAIQGISGFKINMKEIIERIVNIILKKPLKEDVFKQTFSMYADAVLNGDIANKFAADKNYTIIGKEGDLTIFHVSGSPASIEMSLNDRLYFEDATFFESPVILNLADTIRFSKTGFDKNGDTKKQAELLEKAYVPEYVKDLILKLTDHSTKGMQSRIANSIQEIIRGEFYYDPDIRDFVFKKRNQIFIGVSITPGIKYLGALGILSLAGFISNKNLLVIDEPETHIHPQWQVRLAEVIVKMIEAGNYILLTSHSPYFIEALKLYSDDGPAGDKTAFYYSEVKELQPVSRIVNVTHDISPIFDVLAEPFEKLEHLQLRDAS